MRFFFITFFSLFTCLLNGQDAFFQWAKSIKGTNVANGQSIAVDASGNSYTTGYFRGTTDFDPGPMAYNLNPIGGDDVFIVKLNASGAFIWARTFGGAGYEMGMSIAVDIQGNVYTTGFFQDTADFDPGALTYNLESNGGTDIFISKLDSSGVFVWAKKIGGTSYDEGLSLTVDAFGNVYTTGFFSGTVDFDPGAPVYYSSAVASSYDVFVLELSTNGNFILVRKMGGLGNDYGEDIAVDFFGNIYITGSFESSADFDPSSSVYNLFSAGGSDVFICRLDFSGLFVWAQRIGGSSSDYSNSIALDGTGCIYLTGRYHSAADFDTDQAIISLHQQGLVIFM